jgi:PilZ domain-containing protein
MYTASAAAEQRKARRFALEAPVVFSWSDGQTVCEGAGFSRDISTRGLFVIVCSAAPLLACQVELMVLLPPLSPGTPAMRLRSSGSVVRVKNLGKGTGLGITCAFGDFENSDPPASSFSEEKPPVTSS